MTTPNLSLPELAASQSQPHVPINSALRRLDGLVQLSVIDRALNTPPGSPADGDCYILGAAPTGAWSTFDEHDLVIYIGTSWVRYAPLDGWLAYVQDEDKFYHYNADSPAEWTELATGGASPTTTLGDLIRRGASADERLGVGTNGQVLTVVSGQPAWAAAGGGGLEDYQRALYSVIGTQSSPPGSPAAGDLYRVDTSPSGAWSSYGVGQLALYTGSAWSEVQPDLGSLLYDAAASRVYVVDNGPASEPRDWKQVYPPNPYYYVTGSYSGVVPDDAEILRYYAPDNFRFEADFPNSVATVGTAPTDDWVAIVKADGTQIGTISVTTGGAATFETSSNAVQYLDQGTLLTVEAPSGFSPETGPDDIDIAFAMRLDW